MFLTRRSFSAPQACECRPTAMHASVLPQPTSAEAQLKAPLTYSLTGRSSHRTLLPSPSHPQRGSGSSSSLEARQVVRVNRNTPIPGCTALSCCLGPSPLVWGLVPTLVAFPVALPWMRGHPWEHSIPSLQGHPKTRREGGGKEGAIPSRRRGYRPAPALSCWQPAASPASSAPPWRPGPVATATRTLPAATRKHFPPPPAWPVGEQ